MSHTLEQIEKMENCSPHDWETRSGRAASDPAVGGGGYEWKETECKKCGIFIYGTDTLASENRLEEYKKLVQAESEKTIK